MYLEYQRLAFPCPPCGLTSTLTRFLCCEPAYEQSSSFDIQSSTGWPLESMKNLSVAGITFSLDGNA